MRKTKNARIIKQRTRRNVKGGFWPFTSNKSASSQSEPISLNVFDDRRLSTQPNEDRSYEDAGIIHATEAVGINFGRAIITNIANTFGSKGIDLSRYNVARTGALKKLLSHTPEGYKVCNIKMDVENSPQSIHVHAYGTLMKPKMTSSKRMQDEGPLFMQQPSAEAPPSIKPLMEAPPSIKSFEEGPPSIKSSEEAPPSIKPSADPREEEIKLPTLFNAPLK